MVLKRLQVNCDQVWNKNVSLSHLSLSQHSSCFCFFFSSQDLVFATQLVKQSRAPAEVLLEVLRLLLPTLPEGELLAVTNALHPKQHPPPSPAEQEQAGWVAKHDHLLPCCYCVDWPTKNWIWNTAVASLFQVVAVECEQVWLAHPDGLLVHMFIVTLI